MSRQALDVYRSNIDKFVSMPTFASFSEEAIDLTGFHIKDSAGWVGARAFPPSSEGSTADRRPFARGDGA
jgi:hypothetical protein